MGTIWALIEVWACAEIEIILQSALVTSLVECMYSLT